MSKNKIWGIDYDYNWDSFQGENVIVVTLSVANDVGLISEIKEFFESNKFIEEFNLPVKNVNGNKFSQLRFIKTGRKLFKIVEVSKIYDKFKHYLEEGNTVKARSAKTWDVNCEWEMLPEKTYMKVKLNCVFDGFIVDKVKAIMREFEFHSCICITQGDGKDLYYELFFSKEIPCPETIDKYEGYEIQKRLVEFNIKQSDPKLPILHSNKYFKGINFTVDFNNVSFISKDVISLKNGKNVQVQWDNLSEFKLCMDYFIDYLNIPLKNK